VLLIGDALHGCPPSLQQGVSLALDDVLVLAQLIDSQLPVPQTLASFKQQRLAKISWIIDESNKAVKLAQIGKTALGRLIRNTIVRLTGPKNVNGWVKLLQDKL